MKNLVRLGVLGVVVAGLFGGVVYGKKYLENKPIIEKNKYVAFTDEVYGIIKENHWNKLSDEQLNKIYVLGLERIASRSGTMVPANREGMKELVREEVEKRQADEEKEALVTQLADVVLANLEPFGRSRLYSLKEEKELTNNVYNINPAVDRYEELGVSKDASPDEIAEAYKKKPEAKKAYEILSDTDSKKNYDLAGIEPTMEYRLLSPKIAYIHLTKFSPTTVEELTRVTEKLDKGSQAEALIFDLRDNIGGAIDGLPYFLGPFIGLDQYAYQFWHQGEKQDFKTVTGWLPGLVRYKKVVVLINGGAQSTAEVMASVLKKYNVGILVGERTKGWGTIEKVFEIKNQISGKTRYSVFLVHSVTLREDGQPIEGRGVEPVVGINDENWKRELMRYFDFPEMATEIEKLWKK